MTQSNKILLVTILLVTILLVTILLVTILLVTILLIYDNIEDHKVQIWNLNKVNLVSTANKFYY